jgi:tRNA(fMet)-specific endonuclease VapC
MSLYVLDTDHLTLLRFGHTVVTARVATVPPNRIAITVITVEEQLTGWYSRVRKARNAQQLARAYEGLFQVIDSVKSINVLPFTPAAVQRCLDLRKQLPRLGKLDLAIAAIVLEVAGTLVTRNRSDFGQVPQLQIEDWSKP